MKGSNKATRSRILEISIYSSPQGGIYANHGDFTGMHKKYLPQRERQKTERKIQKQHQSILPIL